MDSLSSYDYMHKTKLDSNPNISMREAHELSPLAEMLLTINGYWRAVVFRDVSPLRRYPSPVDRPLHPQEAQSELDKFKKHTVEMENW